MNKETRRKEAKKESSSSPTNLAFDYVDQYDATPRTTFWWPGQAGQKKEREW
jgi:hypothetical protein